MQGGTLDNKVVQTLARAFVQLGYRAVRFNFRGIGASAGLWDEGRGEVDDALAVVDEQGVVVGRVKSLALDPKTFQGVVSLAIDRAFQFPKDTAAKILTAGLLGVRGAGLGGGVARPLGSDAREALLAGRSDFAPRTPVFGCAITRSSR